MNVKNANLITEAQEKKVPKVKTPASIMGGILNAESTKKLLQNTLKENAGAFSASVLDLYSTDTALQKCNPQDVFRECLKAASLKLPINKQLGFAYVVPFKGNPQFQIGYKGLIQLALRTGAYKYINAGAVLEGEFKREDKLTGEIDISGEAASNETAGYFAYIETVNGFKKAMYWSKEKVTGHAERYSQSYKSSYSPWKTNFDEMAIKTVLRNLINHYGIMSIEMANAFEAEDNAGLAAEAMQEEPGTIEVEADVSDISEAPEQEQTEEAAENGVDPYPFN